MHWINTLEYVFWFIEHTHTTVLQLSGLWPGQPGWAGTRRNIHLSYLSWSSVILYLLPASITIHGNLPVQLTCVTVFFHNLSPTFLRSFSWPGTLNFILHTFLHHCLLFAAHAHTTATCFAVVPRLCHLILVSLSLNPLLGTLSCSLMPYIHLTILISVQWSATSPFLPARSHFCATYYFAHTTAVQSPSHCPRPGCLYR